MILIKLCRSRYAWMVHAEPSPSVTLRRRSLWSFRWRILASRWRGYDLCLTPSCGKDPSLSKYTKRMCTMFSFHLWAMLCHRFGHRDVARAISETIRTYYKDAFTCWRDAPEDHRRFWWNCFKVNFSTSPYDKFVTLPLI